MQNDHTEPDTAKEESHEHEMRREVAGGAPDHQEGYDLGTPIDDEDLTWREISLKRPTAGDLWAASAGGSLSMTEQVLVGAARIEGLEEHRRGPWCRKLAAKDFAHLVAVGYRMILELNAGQEDLLARVEAHGDEEAFEFDLRDGFHGRKPGDTDEEAPLVMALRMRPFIGADVWDIPPEGLTLGHVGQLGARGTGYGEPFIKRLSPFDFGRLVAVTSVFLRPFRPTGETP